MWYIVQLVRSREDPYIQDLHSAIGDLPPLHEFPDAVFHPPPGFFDRLEKSGGRYILETPEGIRFECNDDLRIERIVDLNGNQMTFEYIGQLLTRILDPVGKEFILQYDEMNRIQLLFDKTGNRKIGYFYGDNGDLEEVDLFLDPDLVTGTDYRYLGVNHVLE